MSVCVCECQKQEIVRMVTDTRTRTNMSYAFVLILLYLCPHTTVCVPYKTSGVITTVNKSMWSDDKCGFSFYYSVYFLYFYTITKILTQKCRRKTWPGKRREDVARLRSVCSKE
jgi:hypothetical protein